MRRQPLDQYLLLLELVTILVMKTNHPASLRGSRWQDLGPNCVRFAQNMTNPGLFRSNLKHFGSVSQNVVKSDLNLCQSDSLGVKYDTPFQCLHNTCFTNS